MPECHGHFGAALERRAGQLMRGEGGGHALAHGCPCRLSTLQRGLGALPPQPPFRPGPAPAHSPDPLWASGPLPPPHLKLAVSFGPVAAFPPRPVGCSVCRRVLLSSYSIVSERNLSLFSSRFSSLALTFQCLFSRGIYCVNQNTDSTILCYFACHRKKRSTTRSSLSRNLPTHSKWGSFPLPLAAPQG